MEYFMLIMAVFNLYFTIKYAIKNYKIKRNQLTAHERDMVKQCIVNQANCIVALEKNLNPELCAVTLKELDIIKSKI